MAIEVPELLILLFAPLAGMALIALFGVRWPRSVYGVVASAAVTLSFLAALVTLFRLGGTADAVLHQPLWTWAAPGSWSIELGLQADALSLTWALVVTGVGFLIHVYSMGYMAEDEGLGRYFAYMNLFVFTMLLLVLSDNFLGLLFGWGGVGLASYLLIGFWHERPTAVAAARKAFVLNTIGDVGILLAGILMLYQFGSLGFDDVFTAVGSGSAGGRTITVIALLLLVGAVAKSAQLPLHTWLPDAMQGPTPVSALIHAATMVTAGVYLVIRAYPLYQASPTAMAWVAALGAVGALFAATIATVQYDIKRVLAYSTMSQIGYMFMAAGIGAYSAATFHFWTHAFFKALLFLAAGLVIHRLGGEQDLRRMGGLSGKLPFAYRTFLVGALALSGIPVFAGFFSKDEILAAAWNEGYWLLWVIGALVVLLTAFYIFRAVYLAFFGPVPKGLKLHEEHGLPVTVWPVAILTVLSIVGGWLSLPGLFNLPAEVLHPVLEQYPPAAGSPGLALEQPAWISMLVAVFLALTGMHFANRAYGRANSSRQALQERVAGLRGLLSQGYYFDALYRYVFMLPLRETAATLAGPVDRGLIDGAGGGLARWVSYSGTLLSRIQSGFIRRYALTVVAGAALVLIYYSVIL